MAKANKMRSSALLIFFMLIFWFDVFAVSPQKKMSDGLLIETGTSTEDIMPLLTHQAGRFGGYFEKIYGQHRMDYIIIIMNSNGKDTTVDKIEKIADLIVKDAMVYCSSCEGKITLVGYHSDVWNSIDIKFEKGKVAGKEVKPTKEAMQKTLELRKTVPVTKFGLTEEQRKQFYYALIENEERASREANIKYPSDLIKSDEYYFFLLTKYDKKLCENYKITEKEATAIDIEANSKRW